MLLLPVGFVTLLVENSEQGLGMIFKTVTVPSNGREGMRMDAKGLMRLSGIALNARPGLPLT